MAMISINPGDKYHGMTIVGDTDMVTPKGKYVLECNGSVSGVVLRHYNDEMSEDMHAIEVDLLSGIKNGKMTPSMCTGAIKRNIGMRTPLISVSVVAKIEELCS